MQSLDFGVGSYHPTSRRVYLLVDVEFAVGFLTAGDESDEPARNDSNTRASAAPAFWHHVAGANRRIFDSGSAKVTLCQSHAISNEMGQFAEHGNLYGRLTRLTFFKNPTITIVPRTCYDQKARSLCASTPRSLKGSVCLSMRGSGQLSLRSTSHCKQPRGRQSRSPSRVIGAAIVFLRIDYLEA